MRGGEVGGFGEDGRKEVGGWWALCHGARALFQRVVDSGGDYGVGYETRTTSCGECIILT